MNYMAGGTPPSFLCSCLMHGIFYFFYKNRLSAIYKNVNRWNFMESKTAPWENAGKYFLTYNVDKGGNYYDTELYINSNKK